MEKFRDTVGVTFAWLLTYLTLDKIAIVLAIVYSLLQITAFIYPWHKVLWKKFGFKEH